MTTIPLTDRAAVLEEILTERQSVRAFTDDLVPDEVIERILAMAQNTATWCNTQSWQVHLISGEAAREFSKELLAHAAKNPISPDFPEPVSYDGVYGDRRRQSGYALYGALGIAREDKQARAIQGAKNFEFFGAPHAAFISTDANLGVYGAVDVGAYIANFMNAAQALGVATIAQAALAFHPDLVRAKFGLGEDRRIVAGVSFGYKDAEHPVNNFRVPREDIANVLQHIR